MKKRVDNRVCIVYSSYCSDAEQLTYATVAQLVEYDLAKVGVAGSNPVCRSLLRRSGAKALLLFYCNFVIEYVKMSKSIFLFEF